MLREITRPVTGRRVESFIPADAPTRPRAVAVIDGLLSGRVWVDDEEAPTAAVVIEDADGTVYAGGALEPQSVRDVLRSVVTRSGDLIFGFSGPDDPLRELVAGEPYWRGGAIDFTDRRPPTDEEAGSTQPLTGARAVALDASWLRQTEWYADTLHAFGSLENWTELGVGYGVVVGDELVAESLAGPRCRGLLEMGVVTREAHRRRGYGTLVSRLVARACEARGDRVWWNANADNAPSLAIARRLGFRHERPYELVACRTAAEPV